VTPDNSLSLEASWQSLAYAGDVPAARAGFKREPADFVVEEELGFALSGSGEHQCVQVRKTGIATPQLVKLLARAAGVREFDIGYAGLKDRQGICTQWFSVYLPGAHDVDFTRHEAFAFPPESGVEVAFLQQVRNNRKLRRGSHRANRFLIRLRDPAFIAADDAAHKADHEAGDKAGDSAAESCRGTRDARPSEPLRLHLEARLQRIAAEGVPNYFGEQRFGRAGSNVADALAMFREAGGAGSGRRRRHGAGRGMLLSAARSHIFNTLLSERVRDGSWNGCLEGEVMNLDGSDSVFGPEQMSDELLRRVQNFDIHPTGMLWGRGALRSGAGVAALEQRVRDDLAELCDGLERAGLEQARRSLRLPVRELQWDWQGGDLRVSFVLPPGAYATAVLRELCRVEQETAR